MQIRDIEEMTGLERSSIRFYEKEGLIRPERLENGYREYSDEDLKALYKIKLLRSLHMSMEEIKEIFTGVAPFKDLLKTRIESLESEEGEVRYAKEVCITLEKEVNSLEELDGLKYLKLLEEKERETGRTYYPKKEDRVPQVFSPWRRFFSRTFDLGFYGFLIHTVRVFIFHDFIRNYSRGDSALDTILGVVLMMVLEPLFLSKLGTTPGKAIWGLIVRREDGFKPTYKEAFTRTMGVLYHGLAFNMPILGLRTLYLSYKRAEEEKIQPWESGFSYELKDEKRFRPWVYAASHIAILVIFFFFMKYQTLPPNRGELTPAQFLENYRYYEEYFDLHTQYQLTDTGEWVRKKDTWDDGTVVIEVPSYTIRPDFLFEQEGNVLRAISFETEIGNVDHAIGTNVLEMGLAYLAMVGAQEKGRFFSELNPEDILLEIQEKFMVDFTMNHKKITLESKVDVRGYIGVGDNSMILSLEDSTKNFFKQSVKIRIP